MTKTYKHKTLGWIALEYFKSGKFFISKVNDDGTEVELAHNVLPELIGSDREEVVEKDWVDDVLESIRIDEFHLSERGRKEIRRAIEKHAPKQKKFTEEEIESFRYKSFCSLIDFLKEHNLLSDTD